jgi:hypothetical protein
MQKGKWIYKDMSIDNMLAIRAQKVQIQINAKHYQRGQQTGTNALALQLKGKLLVFTMLSGLETTLPLNFVLNIII